MSLSKFRQSRVIANDLATIGEAIFREACEIAKDFNTNQARAIDRLDTLRKNVACAFAEVLQTAGHGLKIHNPEASDKKFCDACGYEIGIGGACNCDFGNPVGSGIVGEPVPQCDRVGG